MPRILKQGDSEQQTPPVSDTNQALHAEAAEPMTNAGTEAVYSQRLRRVVEQVETQLQEVRDVWRQRWEQDAVRLACRIAARCLRDLPFDSTELARTLVAESLRGLRLDATCEVRLHPDDYQVLTKDQQITAHEIMLLPDSQVEPGGCVVRTPDGVIDQRLSSQLSRVEDELTHI